MHPDLSSHLHSAECNDLIQNLKTCHDTKTFGRFLGACNELDTLVRRCLREERKTNQSANRQKALFKQNEFKERLLKQQQHQEQSK